jgi:prepilin-type N-terminal cleavage/methylation domain-containing protein
MRDLRPGFSLIEMLFAMVLLAVVCGGVSTLFFSNTFGADLSGDQSTAMANSQTALRGIAIDSRPGSAFAAPTNTGGVRVTFSSGSPVEYYQSGTTLYKLVASGTPTTTTVVTGLTSGTGLSVTYYDTSMSAIAGPMDATKYGQAAVADVTVRITLAHSTLGQVTRTTRVVLRNKVS